MPIFLRRFTADENLVTMGVTYATVVFAFAVVNMANLAFEKLFQAVGRMKTTMVALIAGCVCNLLLDPLMIFGGGPFPRMGIAGAALATGIGQVTSLLIYLARLLLQQALGAADPESRRSRPQAGQAPVLHWHPGYFEPGAALPAGHLPERTAGGLCAELCSGAGHLL